MDAENQQVVNQQEVDDNNTQGNQTQVEEQYQENPEQSAQERSMSRDEFFSSITDEDIDRFINESYEEPIQQQESKEKIEEPKEKIEEPKEEDKPVEKEPEIASTNPQQEYEEKQKILGENKDTKKIDPPKIEEPKIEKYTIKARNKEFDFSLDELKMMASKGVDYTQKLQKIAPFRKMINAIEENGISEEDINQLIEMKKGNKNAIGAFTKRHNIALSDIEEGESNADTYKPQQYGKELTQLDEIDLELRDTMQNENYMKMVNFVNNADYDSQQFFINNPNALYQLADSVNKGQFDVITKEIEKQSMLNDEFNRLPLVNKYSSIYRKFYDNNNQNANIQKNNSSTAAVNNQDASSSENKSKLGITGTNGVTDSKNKVVDMIDDLSDEEFEKAFKETMGMDFKSYL